MLNLMSLEKVKDILGIVDGSGDARLEAFIPIVSADVREILNDPMDRSYNCLIKGVPLRHGRTSHWDRWWYQRTSSRYLHRRQG